MAGNSKYASIILKRVYESQNPFEQVELISDDEQRISIHRVILTAASKYFAASLGPNWNFQEGNRKEGKELEGADGATLRKIVDYCYSGHIELTEDNVQTFLTIASRYQFDLLEEKCLSFYAGILSVTNSVEALMFAEELSYAGLRQAALDLICKNFESVPAAEVQQLDHQLFQEILESDKITSSEEVIFDRLLKWSECAKREPYVPNLLKRIRLQHIKLKTLNDTVEAFYKRFDCTELMLAEYKRRGPDNHFDSGFRRYPSLFCLFTKYGKRNDPESSVIKVGRLERKSRKWEKIAEFALGKLIHPTVVLNQNKMYSLGGNLNFDVCNTVSSFDLSSRQEEILPNMNISRIYCAAILLEEYIYVFGGMNDHGRLSSCERLDIKRKTWTEIGSMSEVRHDVSVVVMNGCIYIAGGEGDGGATNTFESYDPMRNKWTVLAPMNFSRISFALIQSNGFIYAFGGGGGDSIEKYDRSNDQWTEISLLDYSEEITSGINVNGEIYVLNENGVLRRIKIDESDDCSFFSWETETSYISISPGRHFLTLN